MAQGRKTGGRKKGTPNKDKPYKAALQAVIDKYPDLLEEIALAQLRAAAGLLTEDRYQLVNVSAAKELADRLDGRVVLTAEVGCDPADRKDQQCHRRPVILISRSPAARRIFPRCWFNEKPTEAGARCTWVLPRAARSEPQRRSRAGTFKGLARGRCFRLSCDIL